MKPKPGSVARFVAHRPLYPGGYTYAYRHPETLEHIEVVRAPGEEMHMYVSDSDTEPCPVTLDELALLLDVERVEFAHPSRR